MGAACAPSQIRCLDFDRHVAPLYCAAMNGACDDVSFRVGANGLRADASGDHCGDLPTPAALKMRPPEDWKCETFQKAQAECLDTYNRVSASGCRREDTAAEKKALVQLRTMLRESERLRR
jgi:hypothetical protein